MPTVQIVPKKVSKVENEFGKDILNKWRTLTPVGFHKKSKPFAQAWVNAKSTADAETLANLEKEFLDVIEELKIEAQGLEAKKQEWLEKEEKKRVVRLKTYERREKNLRSKTVNDVRMREKKTAPPTKKSPFTTRLEGTDDVIDYII